VIVDSLWTMFGLLRALPVASVVVPGVTLTRVVQLMLHPSGSVFSQATRVLAALLSRGGDGVVAEALGLGVAQSLVAIVLSPRKQGRMAGLLVVSALAAGGPVAVQVSQ
jgi:hypothetical protein